MNARTKGHSFERAIAERLREIWPDCYATRFKGSLWLDHCGVDLVGTPGFNIQLKAVERLSPGCHEILSAMPKGQNKNIVIHKRNGKGCIVSMRLEDFLRLIAKRVESKKQKQDVRTFVLIFSALKACKLTDSQQTLIQGMKQHFRRNGVLSERQHQTLLEIKQDAKTMSIRTIGLCF